MLLVFITNKILRHRIENEHLNNVGKFRAVKTVPLPFRETDSDGWKIQASVQFLGSQAIKCSLAKATIIEDA